MSSKKGKATPKGKASGGTKAIVMNLPVLAVQSAASVISLSLSVYAAQSELTPLFGSVATTLHLHKIAVALIAVLSFAPSVRTRGASSLSATLLSALACAVPPALHYLATLSARLNDPVLGAILAYLPVLLPAVYLTTRVVRDFVSILPIPTAKGRILGPLVGLVISIAVIQTQKLWNLIPFGRTFSQPVLLIVSGWVLAAAAVPLPTRSAIGPAVQKDFWNNSSYFLVLTLLTTLLAFTLPPARLRTLPFTHSSHLLRTLSSTPSVTGRIVVGEDLNHGFRFLRADHSLLGGMWIGDEKTVRMDDKSPPNYDEEGFRLGDSIYSAFVLQEASRLHERETPQKSALIIGLGVGISAQSFIQHGLSTTIVEIDPAVYSAARKYFGVSEPAAVYLEDARSWVAKHSATANETYDIVIHDCFSGGGVPAQLFTQEFWTDVKRIVDPEGIVAINFAGVIGSNSSKAILVTLQKTFGQCRVFHDLSKDLTAEQIASEFINVVFFCTPSKKPLTFRLAESKDYLSSYLREHVLRALPQRELRLDLIRGDVVPATEDFWVLTDERNPLGAWQDEGALNHWRVMRSILPGYVWETY